MAAPSIRWSHNAEGTRFFNSLRRTMHQSYGSGPVAVSRICEEDSAPQVRVPEPAIDLGQGAAISTDKSERTESMSEGSH